MPTEKQLVKYLTELADGYRKNEEMFQDKLTTEPLSSARWINGVAAARGALLVITQLHEYIQDGKVVGAAPSVALSTPEQDAAASAKFDAKVKSE